MKKNADKLFFYKIAIVGFLTNIILHILTFSSLSLENVKGFAFFIAIIATIPFLLGFVYTADKDEFKKSGKLYFDMTKLPLSIKIVSALLALYVGFNFYYLKDLAGGVPTTTEGVYTIENKGVTIKEITYEEYKKEISYDIRGITGHMLIFYWFSIVMIHSSLGNKKELHLM